MPNHIEINGSVNEPRGWEADREPVEEPQPCRQPTKRDLQARQTKERIFECADALFKEKGYEQTTIADIAALSGTSIGSFYHHFKNKEEIMRIFLSEFDIQYRDYYEKVLCHPKMAETDIIEKICLFLAQTTAVFSAHGFMLSREAYALILRDHAVGSDVVSPARDYYQIIGILVEEAQQSGFIDADIDKGLIIRYLTSICRGCMIEWLLKDGATDLIPSTKVLTRAYLLSIARR